MERVVDSIGPAFEHEELSCALFDRLLERGRVDASPWLDVPFDLEFIKALVRGGPEGAPAHVPATSLRCAARAADDGVPGRDKRFLYDIVANELNGLDVDKLDYFQRDSYFSGVVKVSFDAVRLMQLARVAVVDCEDDEEEPAGGGGSGGSGGGGGSGAHRRAWRALGGGVGWYGGGRDDASSSVAPGSGGGGGRRLRPRRLQVSFPLKCLNEVFHVYQTRFNLHVEVRGGVLYLGVYCRIA